MKKFKKLSALLIAFAMTVSTVVVPASAAVGDILKSDNFENIEAGTDLEVNTPSTSNSNRVLVVNSETQINKGTEEEPDMVVVGTEAHGGENCLYIDRGTSNDYGGYRYVNVSLKYNTAYRYTAYIKLAEETEATIPFFVNVEHIGGFAYSTPAVAVGQEWVKISADFAISDKADPNNRKGGHIGLKSSSVGKGIDIYVDDITIEEIEMPQTAMTAVYDSTGTTATVKLSYERPVKTVLVDTEKKVSTFGNVSAENVVVTGGAATVAGITASNNAKEYTISLTGLEPCTEYSVGLTGAYDTSFIQPVTSVANFSTKLADTLKISDGSVVYSTVSFSNGDGGTGYPKDADGIYTVPFAASESTQAIRITRMPIQPGAKYYVSAFVKDGNPDNESSPEFTAHHNGHSCYVQSDVSVVKGKGKIGTEWQEIAYIISFDDKGNDKTDPTKCVNHGAIKGLSDAENAQPATGHLGFAFMNKADDTLLVKDYKVYVYNPTGVTAAGSIEAVEDVPTETQVTYTFTKSKMLGEITKDSFVLSGGAGAVSAVELVSEGVYNVKLTGLQYKTNYTVKATNAKDVFGVAVADSPVTFKTSFPENIIEGRVPVYYYTVKDAGENVSQAAGENVPFDEAEGAYRLDMISGKQGARVPNVDGTYEGNYYYVGAKVRYVNPAAEGETRTGSVTASREGNGGTGVTMTSNKEVEPTDEYQTVGYSFYATTQPVGKYYHLGFMSTASDDIYIKDMVVKKIPAPGQITTDVTDKSFNMPQSFDIIYTVEGVPAGEVSAANFKISNGGTISGVECVADNVYKLSLTGLEKGTTYTVETENFTDAYFRPLSSKLSFTTVLNDLPAAKNLLQALGRDGSFETATQFGQTANLNGYEITEEEAFDGTHSMKVDVKGRSSDYSARWISLVPGYSKAAVGNMYGKKFAVSFYAKTAEGTNRVRAHWSQANPAYNTWYPAGAYPVEEINADEWTKVEAYFQVTKYTSAQREPWAKSNALNAKYKTLNNHFSITADGNPNSQSEYDALDKALADAKAAEGADIAALTALETTAQTAYDNEYAKVMGEGSIYDAGFHFGFAVDGGAGIVYIDKLEIREMNPLNANVSYVAAMERYDDKFDVEIGLTEGEASKVYLMASKTVDGQCVDIKMTSADVVVLKATSSNVGTIVPATLTLEGIDDSYEVFIWDGAFSPLNQSALISELK